MSFLDGVLTAYTKMASNKFSVRQETKHGRVDDKQVVCGKDTGKFADQIVSLFTLLLGCADVS